MKTQNQNVLKSVLKPVDRHALILHEQLALKRLKELRPEARKSSAWKRSLKRLGKAPLILLSAMLRRPAIELHVAPGQPPVEWHASERARMLRALQIL